MTLRSEFDVKMFGIYKRAKDESGYNATIFFKMISDNGGLETAKLLINSSKPSAGYTALWERGRLDLTVEALVVENKKWHLLFEKSEIERAKNRLVQYEYNVG